MMAHVHLLAAWQNGDIDKIKDIIHDKVQTNVIYEDGNEMEYNYDEFITLIKNSIDKVNDEDLEWQFDVIHKTERGDDNIVVISISTGDERFNRSKTASLCVFTFGTIEGRRQMKRAYIEMDVANN